jgi:hypothetical protein
MIAYLSRGAVIRHGMPMCACGSRLHFSKLDVQMEAVPELQHEHPDFAAWTERQVRSAQRAASHVGGGGSFQCGGCSRFVRRVNEHHDCGFHNDIRGSRNHGRWATGSSSVRVAMPF